MKLRILILLTLIIIVLVGYFTFIASKKTSKLQSPIPDKSLSSQKNTAKPSNRTKEYIDPAGFKFQYPGDIKIEVVDKKDPVYYSSLKLTSSQEGSITMDVTSSKYSSLQEWTNNNKTLTGSSKELKLAGLPAKEITTDGKTVIVAIDLETLFTITKSFTDNSKDYWNSAAKTIVSSFAFEQPTNSSETGISESSGEDVVFEGEEVIE